MSDTPVVDINTPVAEIDKAIAAAQAVPPAEPAPPSPPPAVPPAEPKDYEFVTGAEGIEIKLKTGEVFKGKTLEEAANALAKSLVDTKVYAKGLKEQAVAPPATPPATPPAAPPKEPDWSEQYFQDVLAGKPDDATVLALSKKLGRSPDEVVHTFGQMAEVVDRLKSYELAGSFQTANPDFQPSEENIDAVWAVAAKLADPSAKEPDAGKVQLNHLSAAHAFLKQEAGLGRAKYVAIAPSASPATGVKPATPPPMLPTGNPDMHAVAGIPDEKAMLNMTAAQLDELEKKLKAGLGQ